jgi:50S ribosomal protein L16 3-hydroxylase
MLEQWLAPMTLADFNRDLLRAAPYARPDAARETAKLIDWSALGGVLADAAVDVLVVAQGNAVDQPRPRDLNALRALIQSGIGIVVREVERTGGVFAETASSFARELGGPARLHLFVTPAGTHGFGWHYDREEVFIAQLSGVKNYFFRANTVTRDIQNDPMDFSAFQREASPVGTTTLVGGDWLYVPSGWWHVAECVEDSLSMSLGVMLA